MSEFVSQSFDDRELLVAKGFAVEAARAVAGTLADNFGRPEYTAKGADERSWVTKWDSWAQAVIIDQLAPFNSDVGFRAEEDGVDTNSEVYWTIDPIDGTSHFVRGNEYCTTMIALVDHGIPVVAAILDFIRDDMYTAVVGRGAERHNQGRNSISPLLVSERPIQVSYLELYKIKGDLQALRTQVAIETTGASFLKFSAAGHTLSMVARGGSEGFISLKNTDGKEWDFAPGALLIHEAGGVVRNIRSEGFDVRDSDFIAATPVIFPVLDRIIQESLAA